jgi:hypothetical protein
LYCEARKPASGMVYGTSSYCEARKPASGMVYVHMLIMYSSILTGFFHLMPDCCEGFILLVGIIKHSNLCMRSHIYLFGMRSEQASSGVRMRLPSNGTGCPFGTVTRQTAALSLLDAYRCLPGPLRCAVSASRWEYRWS